MRAYKNDRCNNGFLPMLTTRNRSVFESYIFSLISLRKGYTDLFLTYCISPTQPAIDILLQYDLDLSYSHEIALPHESV